MPLALSFWDLKSEGCETGDSLSGGTLQRSQGQV